MTEKSGAAANPLAATPFSFQYKGGGGRCAGRARRFDQNIDFTRGLQLDLARQKRILRKRGDWRQGGAFVSRGLEAKKNAVRLIVAEQGHIRIGAGVRGKIEHDIEACAGSKRNGPPRRLEGFARLTIDREDQRRDPVESDHHKPRIGGAHDAQPQPRGRRQRFRRPEPRGS